jgi:hypothetical protein
VADSGAEARRYAELLLLERAQEIWQLTVHPRYAIVPAFRDRAGVCHRAVEYEGDFGYVEGGVQVVEDVKGVETDLWRLKRILFLARWRQYDLRVIRAEDVA